MINKKILKERITDKIVFKTSDGYAILKPEGIIRIEADHNYSLLFSIHRDDPIKIYMNLSCVEEKIRSDSFFRCHRSHVVNISHIIQLKHKARRLTTTSGEVPISPDTLKLLKDIINS
ncbi:MAG: LytTR family DNA-binding domain-containing protein [Prolixibacteraceae bacterium]|jgi:two-component system LytT family response regulator|nr:LytTR family DNA-binding domain-containing protein [Prolixibacteraceae bacterium]